MSTGARLVPVPRSSLADASVLHDRLTGVPNRHALQERIHAALAGGAAALIAIGLDGLKEINEDLGHKAGDAVLKGLAIRLPALLGDGSMLARSQGAAFAVVLPGIGDPVRAGQVAATLLDAINRPFDLGDHAVRVRACAGIAIAPSHGDDAKTVIESAELAVNRCAGREGRICLFEPAMRADMAAVRAMNAEIVHAIEGRELELHFQPTFRLADTSIVGAEALLRWNHSARGMLAPAAFMRALESHSLVSEVGDWILDEACRQAALWRRTLLPDARVSVNLFAGQLRAGNLPEIVRSSLRRHALPPNALELEISENTLRESGEGSIRQLQTLRQAKVRLSLDNFGAGATSLSLLKAVPVTTLKIDRVLTGSFLKERVSGALMGALLDMARMLDIDVLAQGIETARQEERLVEMGCGFGQGYRLARPMDPKRFLHFAAKRLKSLRAA